MSAILDIDLLRTFHAVVRLGKFSAAAQQLHKSPAAVSVHVQRLEAVAGGRLLERDNQSVALTPLGKRLLAATADLLHTHDRVLAQLQGTRLAGRITLGVPDEYAAHVIRDILPSFTAAWPNVVLEVKTAPSYTLSQWVQRGKLQLALMSQPRGQGAMAGQVLAVTTPVWVAAAAASRAWPEPLPVALYAADCPYRHALLDSLKRQGRRWRVVLDSPSTQAVRACVEAGLAVGLMDREAVTPAMTVLEGFARIAEHEVVLVRSPSAADDEAINLLTQSLHQYFRL
jgi:DNA-binding transcriptional LysR family regulator